MPHRSPSHSSMWRGRLSCVEDLFLLLCREVSFATITAKGNKQSFGYGSSFAFLVLTKHTKITLCFRKTMHFVCRQRVIAIYSVAADPRQLAVSTSLALNKHEEIQGLLTCGYMLPVGMHLSSFFTNSFFVCTAHVVHSKYSLHDFCNSVLFCMLIHKTTHAAAVCLLNHCNL